MNRLQFFKWIGKGIAAVAVAPLVKYLPEAAPTPPMPLFIYPELTRDTAYWLEPEYMASHPVMATEPDWVAVPHRKETKDANRCDGTERLG